MPCLVKTFTNFIIGEFEKLPQLVVSTIIGHAKVDGKEMSHFQAIQIILVIFMLGFIMYMKHDDITKYDAFMWNWSNNAINDDGIFYYILYQFCHFRQIRWPTREE
jgi:hypothetical protein